MELHPDEQVSPRLRSISEQLTGLEWYAECSPARHAWPRATMAADHASGARLFVIAAWGSKPGRHGQKRWPGHKYRFWFSPPSSNGVRSDWYSIRVEDALMELAGNPRLPVPSDSRRRGFIPREQTGCSCEKLKLHGEAAAREALMRVQAAREAGMVRRREKRYYQCPQDTRAFHLTSREAWTDDAMFHVKHRQGSAP